MLTFNLKKQWYDKIRSGEKTIEYREVKPYWTNRLRNEFRGDGYCCACNYTKPSVVWSREYATLIHNTYLRLGYTKRYMTADITRIEVVDGRDTDLAIDAPVYAIHLANVKEAE